jgi:hypothetical protein
MSRRHRHRAKRRHRELPRDPTAIAPVEVDRLVPQAALAGAASAALRPPPELVVEPPDRVAERQARDLRDGVKGKDRRAYLYLGIAVFVALVVFAILNFIESRGTP